MQRKAEIAPDLFNLEGGRRVVTHQAVLRAYSWLHTQGLLHTGIGRLYEMPGMEPRSASCKVKALYLDYLSGHQIYFFLFFSSFPALFFPWFFFPFPTVFALFLFFFFFNRGVFVLLTKGNALYLFFTYFYWCTMSYTIVNEWISY